MNVPEDATSYAVRYYRDPRWTAQYRIRGIIRETGFVLGRDRYAAYEDAESLVILINGNHPSHPASVVPSREPPTVLAKKPKRGRSLSMSALPSIPPPVAVADSVAKFITTTYTWVCDHYGCHWQASSEDRAQGLEWSIFHSNETGHTTTMYIEKS